MSEKPHFATDSAKRGSFFCSILERKSWFRGDGANSILMKVQFGLVQNAPPQLLGPFSLMEGHDGLEQSTYLQ